jgi:glycosyltransferase involved in cell wall biosynthesis
MRVVYIADIGIEGGATKSLIELVSTMKSEHGVEPIVLTSGNDRLNESLSALGIENHSVGHGAFLQGAPDAAWKKPLKWMLYAVYYYSHYHSSLRKAISAVDWEDVDLIHTNVARDDLGMELSKKTGVPNICHIREFAELDFNCWTYRPHYVKYLAENTHSFIAISEAVKRYWVTKGLPENKIRVIYNGVDYQRIIPADHRKWKNNETIKMVIVGGVIPNKGQYQAIEALCMLPEKVRRHFSLDVIGGITETYKMKLQAPLKKLGILNQVKFLGACSDVYDRLKDYHVGLMCSKAEGFGRVTIEYMHASLVVIASDGGANPELIRDRETGLLYKREDTKTLTEKMIYLWKHRDKMADIADKGQIEAKKYTKQNNAHEIFMEYCRVKEQQ